MEVNVDIDLSSYTRYFAIICYFNKILSHIYFYQGCISNFEVGCFIQKVSFSEYFFIYEAFNDEIQICNYIMRNGPEISSYDLWELDLFVLIGVYY